MNNIKKYYPSTGQSIALLLILILIAVIANIVMMFIDRLDMTIHPAVRQMFLYAIPMAFTCWIGYRQRKSHDNTNKLLSLKTVPVLTWVLLFAGTICLSSVVDIAIYLVPLPESSMDKILEEMVNDATAFHPLVALVMISLLPAILEEVLFRGLILDGFFKQYSPWKAIFLSSLLFGLIHLNAGQFIAGLGAGLFLGWVYYRTKSLLACMFIHAVNNAGGLVQYWATNDINFWLYQRMGKQSFTLFVITSVVALVICIELLKRQFNKSDNTGLQISQ